MDSQALFFVLAGVACLVLAVAVLVWCASYLLGPGVLYLSQRLEARATIVPTPIEAFPAEVRRWACATIEALSCRGFEPCVSVLLPHYVPDLAAYLVLMRNPSTGDRATITAIFSRHTQTALKARYVEFSTRFSNGLCLDTLNSPILGFTERHTQSIKTWLPEVSDPRLLYRMHRHICAASAGGASAGGASAGGVAPLFEEEEEGAVYLARILAEECEEQQKLGLLSLNSERWIFHPTYKGACYNCWSQLWPVSAIRRARTRAQAEQRLAGFKIGVISSRKSWKAGLAVGDEANEAAADEE